MENAKITKNIAGKKVIHHSPEKRKSFPNLINVPRDGVVGGTPTPKKLKVDSAMIASAKPIVPITNTGLKIFGKICLNIIIKLETPIIVEASTIIGVSNLIIMFKHILPNILRPVLVIGTIGLALAIIAESTLSFLGVGVPPTTPSLGTLIRLGNDFLFSGEWWITFFPAIFLVILAFSINLLGDWMRDTLNPRLKK